MKTALSLHRSVSPSLTSPTNPNVVKATCCQTDILIGSITYRLYIRMESPTRRSIRNYPESRMGRELLPALSKCEEHGGWTVIPDLDSEKGNTTEVSIHHANVMRKSSTYRRLVIWLWKSWHWNSRQNSTGDNLTCKTLKQLSMFRYNKPFHCSFLHQIFALILSTNPVHNFRKGDS